MGSVCTGTAKERNITKETHDYLFKVVLVGDAGVGKSSLIIRYADNIFLDEEVGSIGSDFKVSFLDIDKHKVKIQIWYESTKT